MLSKSLGQILRVSAALHVLFHLEEDENLPDMISTRAIEAAIDFVLLKQQLTLLKCVASTQHIFLDVAILIVN